MATDDDRLSKFQDESHIYQVFEALNFQRTIARFCDVILKVCGEQIHAHSNVLAAASPYFSSFLGQGQDLPRAFSQKLPQIIEIHIDGNDIDLGYGDAVRKVLDFMYTGKIELSYCVLTPVIEIAKIMQMDKIIEFCDRFQKGEDDVFINLPYSKHATDADIREVGINTAFVKPVKEVAMQTEQTNFKAIQSIMAHSTAPVTKQDSEMLVPSPMEVDPPLILPKKKRGRPRKQNIERKVVLAAPQKSVEAEGTLKSDSPCNTDIKCEDSDGVSTVKEQKTEFSDEDKEKPNSPFNPDQPLPKRRGRPPWHLNVYHTFTCSEGDVKLTKSDESISTQETEHYSCDDCPYTSTNNFHFRRHRQAHINSNMKYRCDSCDFASPKLKDLLSHKREHLHADNICSFCEYKASSMEDMTNHLQRHTGNYPYFCVYCETRFKTNTQLKLHLPKHSEDKPFVCSTCHCGFKWKHALKNHMIVHSNSKDHLCDICGFSTAHKSQLKAHRLIHTGETFKCDFPGCTFQATKKQNLKYHMLTHTHEKPHQCEICGQSFSLSKNMKRHMLLHSSERPYKCSKCSFSTTRYDKLKYHNFKQHGEGDHPKKRFRITDYPKGFIPDIGADADICDEIDECSLQNIHVRVENTMSTGVNSKEGEELETQEQQIFITNPAGESFPITLARIENVNTSGTADIGYQTIQFVTQVE